MIPIVLAADSNYRIPLEVLIGSLMITARSETKYEIIIITDELFDEMKLDKLKLKFDRLVFKIIRISVENFSNAQIFNEGLSVFTYCRLFIPQILNNYDKCIYIDTDTLVTDDLSDMYKTNVDGYYLAGVKDYGLQNGGYDRKAISRLEIPSLTNYLNAGVLLLNLKKIRDDNIYSLFMECIGEQWLFEDQDIINKCCYEKIDFLPVRYNVLYRYFKRSEFWNEGFYPQEDMLIAQERPAIIHFTGRDMKPWKFIRSRAAIEWWRVASGVLLKNEYEDILRTAQFNDEKMHWKYIIDNCQNKEVVIFGAFEIGKNLLRWLQNEEIKIKCFCDNDEDKKGKYIDTIEIKSFEEVLKEECVNDYIFIVASQRHSNAIVQQLKNNDIERVINFFYKTEFYYMALDDSYFELELKEIEEKEKLNRSSFTEEIYTKYWMDRWVYQ